jgi:hypothetical protein
MTVSTLMWVATDRCPTLPLRVRISPSCTIRSYVDWLSSAFDPIFFLHHTNVDRLLSLWSALNPGVWVTRGEATGGTWTILPDAPVDKNTGNTSVVKKMLSTY